MPDHTEGPLQVEVDPERPALTTVRTCKWCDGKGGGQVAVDEWQECDRCDGVTGWQILVAEPDTWMGLLDALALMRPVVAEALRITAYYRVDRTDLGPEHEERVRREYRYSANYLAKQGGGAYNDLIAVCDAYRKDHANA